MIIVLSILCGIATAAAVYFGWRAYVLAGILTDDREYLDELEGLYAMLIDKTRAAYEEIQRIDNKKIFESDDDVGTIFALLKQVIENLTEGQDGTEKEEE